MPYSDTLRNPDIEVQTVLRDVSIGVPHFFAFKPWEVFISFLIAAVR
jgi:hypothetical protein